MLTLDEVAETMKTADGYSELYSKFGDVNNIAEMEREEVRNLNGLALSQAFSIFKTSREVGGVFVWFQLIYSRVFDICFYTTVQDARNLLVLRRWL